MRTPRSACGSRPWQFGGVARAGAVALLASVLLAGLAACTDAKSPAAAPAAVAPEPLGPRGVTEGPLAFSWKPVPGKPPVYRVQVADAAERVLFEQDVRATRCRPPPNFSP